MSNSASLQIDSGTTDVNAGAWCLCHLETAMKKFILMSLVTATALSPMAVYAAEVVPVSVRASADVDSSADFQRDERRAERRGQGNGGGEGRSARRQGNPDNVNRAERQQNRAERRQAAPVQAAPVQVNRAERHGDGYRGQRREASQQGRYYDRNRDGSLDRRWDQNRDGNLDRNYDRNRDGRLDRRLDRNDDERIDRRYDQNRNGDIDRRYDRNNDNRVDRSYNGGRSERWSSNWRNDNRYDWRGHRDRYSNSYRPGRYYSPYRDRGYNRISIGFSLGSGYYGSRYWINDPWQYRLPAAYGPYRWVRYYDDVLLVDLRSGRVVDVIRDFFW
jgi:Nickel/cobalt transporter regulator